jgi:hypothetical protein
MTDPTRISDDQHNNASAVPQGEQATIAGLDAANGHLSTLLDDSVLMLKQLRQMVDDLHERWSNGGKPERGEFELLDRVDDWLSCRPDSMLSPPAPAPAPAQEVGLTEGEIQALGHRIATTYRHDEDGFRRQYAFNIYTLVDFANAIIAALRAKGGK